MSPGLCVAVNACLTTFRLTTMLLAAISGVEISGGVLGIYLIHDQTRHADTETHYLGKQSRRRLHFLFFSGDDVAFLGMASTNCDGSDVIVACILF